MKINYRLQGLNLKYLAITQWLEHVRSLENLVDAETEIFRNSGKLNAPEESEKFEKSISHGNSRNSGEFKRLQWILVLEECSKDLKNVKILEN